MRNIRPINTLLLSSLLILLSCTISHSAGITTDGTLGTATTLSPVGKDITISASLGQQKGANLFHSFRDFNVDTGYNATFTGSAGTANVISRVTGGSASWIDGKLGCDIAGADLWLLNPFGLLFGPNASLDVKGSFHASTADSLQFSDGGVFYMDPSKNSMLSVAAPSAFGFINDNPADISVKRSSLEVSTGKDISLIGGDIAIVNGFLYAPGGKVSLASLNSPGKVEIEANGLNVTESNELGDISISNAKDEDYIINISVSGDGTGDSSGSIDMHCKKFSMEYSMITSYNFSDTTTGGKIFLLADESASINNSSIYNNSVGNAAGGDILIQTERLSLTDGAQLMTVSYGAGHGGNIDIKAKEIVIDGGYETSDGFYLSIIASQTNEGSTGNSGDMNILTESLTVSNGGLISSTTYNNGDSGNINIHAKTIQIDGGLLTSNDFFPSKIKCQANNPGFSGNAGNVNILTESLTVSNGGLISSITYDNGDSGNINIHAKTIQIDGGLLTSNDFFLSKITCQANNPGFSGNAGSININTETLDMSNGGEMVATTFGDGEGGAISIHAKAVSIEGGFETKDGFYSSVIVSTTESSGNAGTLNIEVESLSLADGGRITASTFGSGNGGNITIHADNVRIKGGLETTDDTTTSMITCQSNPEASGDAGTLDIHAHSLELTDGGRLIASTLGSGKGGSITITANEISVDGGFKGNLGFFPSMISCSTESTGDAGSLDIHSDSLKISNGGQVSASTLGYGDGGNIAIHANNIAIDGGFSDSDEISLSMITCQTESSGNAGSLHIETESLALSNGGQLAALTFGNGDGGNIDITAKNISVNGLFQDNYGLYPSNIICTAEYDTAGKAGQIVIQADTLSTSNGGEISVTSYGKGSGGNITIDAKTLNMNSGSAILSASTSNGNAGNIDLTITDRLECRNSAITTKSLQADGGDITIRNTGFIVWLVESVVTATVGGGPQTTGGNIHIESPYIVLNHSDVVANAYEGNGGSIRINTGTYLADWTSTVSASSSKGISGQVDINSPLVDLSGLLSPLPTAFVDITELLANDCETRYKHGKASSLVVRGRNALPAQPGDLWPSPVITQ
jgi:filamentous hemagglutinin family protein